jgi:hypothetical protein
LQQFGTDFVANLDNASMQAQADLRNYLAGIVGVLQVANLDAQSEVDGAFASGMQTLSFSLVVPDGNSQLPGGAGVVLQEPGGIPGTFCGAFQGNSFQSAVALAGEQPVEMDLSLAFLNGIRIPLVGLQLTASVSADGRSITGVLVGAMREDDVQLRIFPSLATVLTDKVRNDPMSTSSQAILEYFDDGGIATSACQTTRSCNGTPAGAGACQNPPAVGERPGLCADACDGIIDTCELSNSALVGTPSLSLFDSQGWDPDHNRFPHDSRSFGLGLSGTAK